MITDERGFTLVECLLSLTILLVVVGTILTLVAPFPSALQLGSERMELQQRLRVGAITLFNQAANAGNALPAIPAVFPYRRGGNASYDDGEVRFRRDAISMIAVPSSAREASLADVLTGLPAFVAINRDAGCPPEGAETLCGFRPGMQVMVYDRSGAFDLASVRSVEPGGLQLDLEQRGSLTGVYQRGARIVPIEEHVYFLDVLTNQLMHYDGTTTGRAVPVLDSVAEFAVDYYGVAAPPVLMQPDRDRSVTYGPIPPHLDQAGGPSWPPGANCTFAVVGGEDDVRQVPRLEHLPSSDGLVQLTQPQLTDGPWCRDPLSANQWDADLLRIRRLGVTLRVQAGLPRFRGSDPRLFRNPGTSISFTRAIPDREIRIDIALRNLGLVR